MWIVFCRVGEDNGRVYVILNLGGYLFILFRCSVFRVWYKLVCLRFILFGYWLVGILCFYFVILFGRFLKVIGEFFLSNKKKFLLKINYFFR